MYMHTIYVAVLSRWCDQRDFVVPFNVAGRQSEHKNVIGYFSHTLCLRPQLTGNESFQELLSLVSNEFFRAMTHQDFGLTATKQPELLEGTFFQWITWQQEGSAAGPDAASESGLKSEHFSFRDFGEGLTAIPPGVVDVEVTFFDTTDGIYALGVYRADRFTSDAMERFMEDLRSASVEFTRDPQVRVMAAVSGSRRVADLAAS
jgi:non-ribosomal peptide synthetase component F